MRTSEPLSVATTGTPAAMASRAAMPNPSAVGRVRSDLVSTARASNAPRYRPAPSTGPVNATRSPTPAAAAIPRSRSVSPGVA